MFCCKFFIYLQIMRYKDEQEILALIRNDNPDGVKCLFDLYYKPLCVFAMNFTDSFEESEDIVQELFVRFWEKYRGKVFEGSLRAYLFSSVQHNCIKSLKSKTHSRFPVIPEICAEESSYREEELEIQCQKLYAEIARLPEQCRKVFELIVLEDMRYKEVALSLNLSVNTVKTHFARALKQLRSSIQILLFVLLRNRGVL